MKPKSLINYIKHPPLTGRANNRIIPTMLDLHSEFVLPFIGKKHRVSS